ERTEAAHKRMARKRVWGIGIPLATLGLCLAVLPGRLDTTPRSTEANQILPVKAQLPEVGGTSSPNSGTDQAQVTTPPETTPLPNAQGSGSQTGSSVENATVAAVEGIRSKGEEVTLLVHRRTQGKTQRLFQGDTIHPGEMLQLSVQTTRPIHAWILSRDATGEVAVHLPETAAKASAIDSGIHAMPHAWELDNSTGFERFWIVWASGSFEIKELERSVRALPRDAVQLPLPAGLSQRSFTLPKTAP
ncbi:MAG: hypothetical protein RL318_2140, partial [Fibrobacterota bacterium]